MLKPEMKHFIHTHYLKKGLELEDHRVAVSDHVYELDVYQVSTRIRKRVARITGMMIELEEGQNQDLPASMQEKVMNLFYSTRVRKTDADLGRNGLTESDIKDLMHQGLILRMVRYGADGRTEKRSEYMMGFRLFTLLEQQKTENAEKTKALIEQWRGALMSALTSIQVRSDRAPGCSVSAAMMAEYRQSFWLFMEKVVAEWVQASSMKDIAVALQVDRLSWSEKKLLLYAEFVIAVAEITSVKSHFDWKEIGARYYREIGGSKRFDAHKRSFLEQIEENLGFPLQLVGLSSQGVITPIYFAGELTGVGGFQYPQGFLHATTDLTVFNTHFFTKCRVLWLVENRAVLTRMVAESRFLSSSDSLVVGIDGQLRSGHRKLISDVLTHSEQVQQILVWCDVDDSGFVISKNIQALLQSITTLNVKWVLPIPSAMHREQFQREVLSWEAFEIEMEKRLSLEAAGEQEAEMGGVDRWTSWLEA